MSTNNVRNSFISVVIPCFNSEKNINFLIQRLIEESLKVDFLVDIIIIDDCSTDGTAQIINDLVSKSKFLYNIKIKAIFNDVNKGVSAAGNIGINDVESDYFTFFDSDDLPEKNYFKIIYDFISKCPEFMFHTFSYNLNGRPVGIGRDDDQIINYLQNHYFCTNTIVISKKIINDTYFRLGYSAGEDEDLWLRLLSKYTSRHCSEVIANYLFVQKIHLIEKEHPVIASIKEDLINKKYVPIIKKIYTDRAVFSKVFHFGFCGVRIKDIINVRFSTFLKIVLLTTFGRKFYLFLMKIKWQFC